MRVDDFAANAKWGIKRLDLAKDAPDMLLDGNLMAHICRNRLWQALTAPQAFC